MYRSRKFSFSFRWQPGVAVMGVPFSFCFAFYSRWPLDGSSSRRRRRKGASRGPSLQPPLSYWANISPALASVFIYIHTYCIHIYIYSAGAVCWIYRGLYRPGFSDISVCIGIKREREMVPAFMYAIEKRRTKKKEEEEAGHSTFDWAEREEEIPWIIGRQPFW